jgi:hypothetical protein
VGRFREVRQRGGHELGTMGRLKPAPTLWQGLRREP